MSFQTWWLFVMMTFVVSATPGPNMLLVMRSSARYGFRAAVATMAGCMTVLLAMMSISAAGLGALLQAFPSVFDVLRWTGAAYLAFEATDSASEKLLYIYRLLVHDKVIQPLPEDQVSEKALRHKLALWYAKQLPVDHALLQK